MGSLHVTDLVVEYVTDGYAIRPLDGLTFSSEPGELVVLLGPSGSGKTTLLSCLGGILTPTAGSIRLGDTEVSSLGARELVDYRRSQVGFVFQAFNLIPSLSARENVAMPLILTGHARRAAFARADELLERVDLADRADHRPSQLSGGQQQRVAVARGLGNDPALLLADEPTANLDHVQAESVIGLLRDLRAQGRNIVVSTHDQRLVPIADRLVEMVPEVERVDEPTHEVSFAAGTVIFEQGDASDLVYVIRTGEIDVYRDLVDGAEVFIRRLGPGNYFGELGPFLGFPRSASVRAHSDVVLTAYSPEVFRREVQA